MAFTKILTGALALAGMFAPSAIAMAPLSDNVHTETAAGQEIGTMTSEGYLVYSMNQCTIVQTTSCSITLSTGAPAPSYEASESSGSGTSIDSTGAHTDYPLPTEGDGEAPTESAGYSQSTDVVPSGDEPTETGIETATSTASDGDGSTSSLETTGTATDTGASSTSATDISETDAPSAATTAFGTLSAMACVLAAMLLI